MSRGRETRFAIAFCVVPLTAAASNDPIPEVLRAVDAKHLEHTAPMPRATG